MGAHGRFVWYELVTLDTAAAVDFYSALLGWSTQAAEGMDYTMWLGPNGRALGGLGLLPDEARAQGAPPHWLGFVDVEDIDATVAQAKELGGAVQVPATVIPDAGRFAILADRQGATFGVYQNAVPTPDVPPTEPGHGEFSWHELATTDHADALAFYGELFGWAVIDSHDMGAMGAYVTYGKDGVPLGGMYDKPAQMPGPPTFCYYATVRDLGAAVAAAREGGATVLFDEHTVPGGDKISQLLDPQGAYFALHWAAPKVAPAGSLAELDGTRWQGTNTLWLNEDAEAAVSDATVAIDGDQVSYTWSYEGKAKRGSIEVRPDGGALWRDSWHQPEPMACARAAPTTALLAVSGSYPAPPGADWGWRLALSLRPSGELVLRMTNVTPWGEEQLAVRLIATRVG